MGGISEEAIRKRAYDIWEREGRQHGHDFEHWVRAQIELAAETAAVSTPRAAAAPRARPTNGKSAASKTVRSAPARSARAKKPA